MMKNFRISLIGWYLILIAFVACSLICLTGCKSIKSVEKDTEVHKVSQLSDKIDSLIHSTAVFQQDIWHRQSSLVDSIRQMERNDSSHTVVVNEKGDTVKEVIIRERVIERERSTESKESEMLVQLREQFDSLLHVSVRQQALTDSILKEHGKETVIEKEPTLWQKIKSTIGGYAILITIIVLILSTVKVVKLIRKRSGTY